MIREDDFVKERVKEGLEFGPSTMKMKIERNVLSE